MAENSTLGVSACLPAACMGHISGKTSGKTPQRRQAPLPRLLRWLAEYARVAGRSGGRWLVATGGPLAARGATATLRGGAAASGALGRAIVRRRAVVLAMLMRAAWVVSLWLAVKGTAVLLGVSPMGSDRDVLAPFGFGIVVAAAVVALSTERHLRRGAVALGALHVALLVLAWTAVSSVG